MPKTDLTPARCLSTQGVVDSISFTDSIAHIKSVAADFGVRIPLSDADRIALIHFADLKPHARVFLLAEVAAGNPDAVADTHDAIQWETIDSD